MPPTGRPRKKKGAKKREEGSVESKPAEEKNEETSNLSEDNQADRERGVQGTPEPDTGNDETDSDSADASDIENTNAVSEGRRTRSGFKTAQSIFKNPPTSKKEKANKTKTTDEKTTQPRQEKEAPETKKGAGQNDPTKEKSAGTSSDEEFDMEAFKALTEKVEETAAEEDADVTRVEEEIPVDTLVKTEVIPDAFEDIRRRSTHDWSEEELKPFMHTYHYKPQKGIPHTIPLPARKFWDPQTDVVGNFETPSKGIQQPGMKYFQDTMITVQDGKDGPIHRLPITAVRMISLDTTGFPYISEPDKDEKTPLPINVRPSSAYLGALLTMNNTRRRSQWRYFPADIAPGGSPYPTFISKGEPFFPRALEIDYPDGKGKNKRDLRFAYYQLSTHGPVIWLGMEGFKAKKQPLSFWANLHHFAIDITPGLPPMPVTEHPVEILRRESRITRFFLQPKDVTSALQKAKATIIPLYQKWKDNTLTQEEVTSIIESLPTRGYDALQPAYDHFEHAYITQSILEQVQIEQQSALKTAENALFSIAKALYGAMRNLQQHDASVKVDKFEESLAQLLQTVLDQYNRAATAIDEVRTTRTETREICRGLPSAERLFFHECIVHRTIYPTQDVVKAAIRRCVLRTKNWLPRVTEASDFAPSLDAPQIEDPRYPVQLNSDNTSFHISEALLNLEEKLKSEALPGRVRKAKDDTLTKVEKVKESSPELPLIKTSTEPKTSKRKVSTQGMAPREPKPKRVKVTPTPVTPHPTSGPASSPASSAKQAVSKNGDDSDNEEALGKKLLHAASKVVKRPCPGQGTKEEALTKGVSWYDSKDPPPYLPVHEGYGWIFRPEKKLGTNQRDMLRELLTTFKQSKAGRKADLAIRLTKYVNKEGIANCKRLKGVGAVIVIEE